MEILLLEFIPEHGLVVLFVSAIHILGGFAALHFIMRSRTIFSEALFNTFQIAEKTIVGQKLASHTPDIYIEPDVKNVTVLEFMKAEQI